MIKTIILLWLFTIAGSGSRAQQSLTAEYIINKSIEFSGGEENIAAIKTTTLIYDFVASDSSTSSVLVKRETPNRYMRSILSGKHTQSSMHYNGTTLTTVEGEEKRVITETSAIEEVKLLAYNLPQYGYKALAYTLKRLEDQHFGQLNCYVVSATAKNGYYTLNYFDKTNFRLVMIIYPKGNKSLLVEYEFRDNILFNTFIINIEETGEQSYLIVKKGGNNNPISPLWFQAGDGTTITVPPHIKQGVFMATDGTAISRKEKIEVSKASLIENEKMYYLGWYNSYMYAMVSLTSAKKPMESRRGEGILAKIVAWNDDEYVCHFLAEGIGWWEEYSRVNLK